MEKSLLIFNCGSSSLNYKLYASSESGELSLTARGKAYHVGTRSEEEAYLLHYAGHDSTREVMPLPTHRDAAGAVLQHLQRSGLMVELIGHRFVHGGMRFQASTAVTPQVIEGLEGCAPLAPIHNPNSLSVIYLCREVLPDTPQYAAFDTAFHAAMPEKAYRYALPEKLVKRFGFRKYGFHGLSYQYVCLQASRILEQPLEELKMVVCHLGTGGSSAAAVYGGRSLDTSMGYSPLPGLVMSTRSGDLDTAVALELIEQHGYSPAEVNRLLNKESGLVGVSGFTSDLLEIIQRAEETDDERARLAMEMYIHRLKSYIGAYMALLEGAHALIFTDDIGVRSWQVRQQVCEGMGWCGLKLDPEVNRHASVESASVVSAADSKIKVLVIPTDEEYVIAHEGVQLLATGDLKV